ncbi:hypothetical protein B9Z19DRAFT_371550 [Tuber borchii]|uniref:Uncharacterized protein n=1 Tax=Tuber borchii TaxID=42251 RepID=A0A2T6ZI04_TUBBO|nr:hypothetical protein B9Z19DRAFT_371550 [Tuber borchii]
MHLPGASSLMLLGSLLLSLDKPPEGHRRGTQISEVRRRRREQEFSLLRFWGNVRKGCKNSVRESNTGRENCGSCV